MKLSLIESLFPGRAARLIRTRARWAARRKRLASADETLERLRRELAEEKSLSSEAISKGENEIEELEAALLARREALEEAEREISERRHYSRRFSKWFSRLFRRLLGRAEANENVRAETLSDWRERRDSVREGLVTLRESIAKAKGKHLEIQAAQRAIESQIALLAARRERDAVEAAQFESEINREIAALALLSPLHLLAHRLTLTDDEAVADPERVIRALLALKEIETRMGFPSLAASSGNGTGDPNQLASRLTRAIEDDFEETDCSSAAMTVARGFFQTASHGSNKMSNAQIMIAPALVEGFLKRDRWRPQGIGAAVASGARVAFWTGASAVDNASDETADMRKNREESLAVLRNRLGLD